MAECSIVDPCNECAYCSGYRSWLFAADNMEQCPDCGGMFCDGTCPESYTNAEEDIARHVAQCTKEQCYVCECM